MFAGQIGPALAHLQSPPDTPTLDVSLWDGAASDEALPPPFWDWDNRSAHGVLRGLGDGRFAAFYDATDSFTMLDLLENRAIVWTADARHLPAWEIACPLRYLVDLWCAPQPYVRLHAGCVGSAAGCVLIAGNSGSGKSTTCLACLSAGMGYLADDYTLVDTERAIAYSLCNTGKLSDDTMNRLPEFAAHIANPWRAGDEKAFMYLDRAFLEQIVRTAPVRAIVLPRITGHRDSAIQPASTVTSLQALAPSTLFQAAEGTTVVFEKIRRLARAVPSYVLNAGTDLSQLPGLIAGLL
jgi:hypothetical protein